MHLSQVCVPLFAVQKIDDVLVILTSALSVFEAVVVAMLDL